MHAGLEGFFGGIDAWHKAWPGTMPALITVARHLRLHCASPDEHIAKNSQRTMAIWAGRFQMSANKGVRHFFAKDLLHWLKHAQDEARTEICVALAKCGPHLLGRFSQAYVWALSDLCGTSRNQTCRSSALQALRVFIESDKNLFRMIRPRLLDLWYFGTRRFDDDILNLVGEMDWQVTQERMYRGLLSSKSLALSIFASCQWMLSMDPLSMCHGVEIAADHSCELCTFKV